MEALCDGVLFGLEEVVGVGGGFGGAAEVAGGGVAEDVVDLLAEVGAGLDGVAVALEGDAVAVGLDLEDDGGGAGGLAEHVAQGGQFAVPVARGSVGVVGQKARHSDLRGRARLRVRSGGESIGRARLGRSCDLGRAVSLAG